MPHAYGYLLDTHDPRDLLFTALKPDAALPRRVDLSETGHMPPVLDQGQLGSCTAHGTLGVFGYAARKTGITDPALSRLQLYYDTRALEGTVDQDAGGQIRDAIKAAAAGVAPETDWPYDIAKFAHKPPKKAVTDAAQNLALTYQRVACDQLHYMSALASGWPIVDGMPVYESMETEQAAQTGVVPMPQPGEQLLGGHCTFTYGYDLDAGVWFCRNSWGDQWGQKGDFTLPLPYVKLKSDAWLITAVS